MDIQQFHVSYCYGSQENFLKALREGDYEKAEAILERIPHGSTVTQEVERQVLLREGYCMLMKAYKKMETVSQLKKYDEEYLSRLIEINVTDADNLEKLVAGHQALCNKLEEKGGKVRRVGDAYTKAIELFEKLEDELEDYHGLGDPEDIKERLYDLDTLRNALS